MRLRLVGLGLLFATGTLCAQTEQPVLINVQVQDPVAAVVPGAKASVRNQIGVVIADSKTDGRGEAKFVLEQGEY